MTLTAFKANLKRAISNGETVEIGGGIFNKSELVQVLQALQTQTHRETLRAIRREWANDFLSVSTFADHHHLTDAQAHELIALARRVDSSKNPHA